MEQITITTNNITVIKIGQPRIKYTLEMVESAVMLHNAIEFYKEHSDLLCMEEVLVDYGFDIYRVNKLFEAFPFLKEEYTNA